MFSRLFARSSSAFVLALASLVSSVSAQQEWYVDVNGTPPGTGTQADPYTSIQYAITQPTTVDNDVIWVAPGTYYESIQVPTGLVITVRSTAGPLVTRLEQTVFGGTAVNSGSDSSFLWLIGFHVRTAGAGATLAVGALKRCILEHVGPYASQTHGVHNIISVLLENCTITGFGVGIKEFGLGVGGHVYLNTLFYGNGSDMISPNGYAATEYCSYQSGLPFQPVGNIVGQDPQIWNLAGSDFHLAPLSHCIDAGDPSMLDADGSRIDIGAIPYDPTYATTPTTYCTPKVTSQGCAPIVTWTGSPSLSGPDDFFLTASPALNNKVGKFIWGAAPKANPFLGGTLCLKLPFVRGPHLNSGGSAGGLDCSGTYAWHFSQAYMAQKAIPAGSILYAQAWGRDPGFADPNNSQLSDAIVFQVAP